VVPATACGVIYERLFRGGEGLRGMTRGGCGRTHESLGLLPVVRLGSGSKGGGWGEGGREIGKSGSVGVDGLWFRGQRREGAETRK
jgi:hypothetical protein